MPIPSMILPKMSIPRLIAAAFKAAPIRKLIPPQIILVRRPYILVTGPATTDAAIPARYREEVKAASL